MTEEAKEARRAYKRKWARENPDKIRAQQARYYERVAESKRRNGQQEPASDEERAARMAALETQGRKGCKAERINLAFTPENHEFIRRISMARGITMTQFCNEIIDDFRADFRQKTSDVLWNELFASVALADGRDANLWNMLMECLDGRVAGR